jgi:transcriptional regulator with XRE-family HTH domain
MGKIGRSVNDHSSRVTYIWDVAERAPHFLREWREFRHMTQDELAAAVGTSKSVVSDMERNKLQLSPKWARRFAPVLKTQPGYIVDHDPADLDTDIIDIWAHIPDSDKATARRVLESFRRTGTND